MKLKAKPRRSRWSTLIAWIADKQIVLLVFGAILGFGTSLATGAYEGFRKKAELSQTRLNEAMKREEEALQSEISADLSFLDELFAETERHMRDLEVAHRDIASIMDYVRDNPITTSPDSDISTKPDRYQELLEASRDISQSMVDFLDRQQRSRLQKERKLQWKLGLGSMYDSKVASVTYLMSLSIRALSDTQFSNSDGGPWPFSPFYLQKLPPEDYLADVIYKTRDKASDALHEQQTSLGKQYMDFTQVAADKIEEKRKRLRKLRWGDATPPY